MFQKLKSYMMPLAMLVGGLFYEYTSLLSPTTPWLISTMLFITYCGVLIGEIRLSKFNIWLLAIQLLGSVFVYVALLPLNVVVAQGAMICVLAPTATSAPIIAKMLGGDVAAVAVHSLISNLVLVLVVPVFFASVGGVESVSFIDSALMIGEKVFLLLLLPFLLANVLKWLSPTVHGKILKAQGVSFYLWILALIVVTGKTVSFIVGQDSGSYYIEIVLALISLIICVTQFFVGRRIGGFYGGAVAGGQSLGQKNTILAIWMAQTYLNPISSVAPGMYVLWQNIINSYQVWGVRKKV